MIQAELLSRCKGCPSSVRKAVTGSRHNHDIAAAGSLCTSEVPMTASRLIPVVARATVFIR